MTGMEQRVSTGSHANRRALLKSVSAATAAGLAGYLTPRTGDSGNIRVGATIPETGRLSGLGKELRDGYELGVKHANESDDFDGEIDLRLVDDESDPKKVGQKLRKLVSDEDVTMVWGSITTPMVMGASAVAEREELPFLGVGFAYEQPHDEKDLSWTFVPYPKTSHIVRTTVRLLEDIPADQRPSNIGIWEPNSGWGEEMASAWESEFSSAGYDVVFREKFSFGTKDFSSLVAKSADRDVEVLLSNPIPPDGITAVKQMKEHGFAPKLLMFVRAAHSNGWWKSLGSDGDYTLTSPGWVPGLTGNGNEQFREDYDSEYGAGDMTIPVVTGGAYNLTQVAVQALTYADSTAPQEIRSVLREETFGTVIGEFGFEDNGMLTDELKTPTGQWWQGSQRLIYPDSDSELAMDLKYPMEPW